MSQFAIAVAVGILIPLLLAFSINLRDWVLHWYNDHYHHHHPA